MPTPYPYPVIFLPGILGSALRDQYPVDAETVWSPYKLLIKSYDRITLHPSDTRYELKEPARVSADDVFGIVYAELIEELRHNLTPREDHPVPVFPFGYDWRQPLDVIEGQLAKFVEEVIERTSLLKHYHAAGYGTKKFPARVNLVAHSMGGLIVAGYVQGAGESLVHRVATIASPFRGSLDAVSKTAMGTGTLGGGSSSSRDREAARVTPAVYHLLPSFKQAVVADGGLSDDLFLPESWQPGVLQTLASFIELYGLDGKGTTAAAIALLKSMLDVAWRHRSRIEKLELKNSKSWLSIVGVGEDTRVGMRISPDAKGKPSFDLDDSWVRNNWDPKAGNGTDTGDNTVPYFGARARFIPAEQVVCVSPKDFGLLELKDRFMQAFGFHSSLPNMNLVQRLVVSHFREAPYGKIWGRPAPDLPPASKWDPPIAGLPKA